MNSLVSAIIPAFNSSSCVGRAIESALLQVPPPLEVIVIDDGSTDDTGLVARSFGSRVVCLEQQNRGQGAARNAGLRVARGEFIAFLDADDFWLPGLLGACLSFLREHPETIAVSTGVRFLKQGRTPQEWPEGQVNPNGNYWQPFVIDDFFDFWGKYDHVRTGSNVIRASLIRTAGLQQEHLRVSQDLEYWGYLATFGRWGFIPTVYWVGDSEAAGVAGGWLKKYKTRRRLCPTVEQWQERILPRLRSEDWNGFRKVRGRVAAGYAQNLILAGRTPVARQIARDYGQELPDHWAARLLNAGCRGGSLAWWLACGLIITREYEKAIVFSIQNWLRKLGPSPKRRIADSACPAIENNGSSERITCLGTSEATDSGYLNESARGTVPGLISVIVPACDSARTLGNTLDSVFLQQPGPHEIIVIDDGSKDETRTLAARFLPRVTILSQPRRGPAAARNAGVRAARGEFVAFLDADDYWEPEFLKTCRDFLARHAECIAVSTGLCFIRRNGTREYAPALAPWGDPSSCHRETAEVGPSSHGIVSEGRKATEGWVLDSFFDFWLEHDHVRTGSVLVRRDALLAVGLQNSALRIAEDLELWSILGLHGAWGFIPEPLWVCDSERAGVVTGWRKKYRDRRANCPTVEQWQERILPRLREADWPLFKRMRGRVAAMLAHNQILGGQPDVAREIVRNYGEEMPSLWSSNLMRVGGRNGAVGWQAACFLLRLREYQKAAFMSLRPPPALPAEA